MQVPLVANIILSSKATKLPYIKYLFNYHLISNVSINISSNIFELNQEQRMIRIKITV